MKLLFRRIWLTNGILLLLLLIGGVGVAAYSILSQLWGSDEHGARPAPTEGTGSADIRPRVIRYEVTRRYDWIAALLTTPGMWVRTAIRDHFRRAA